MHPRTSLLVALLFAMLLLARSAGADYLLVRRDATLKSAPRRDVSTLKRLEPGMHLALVSDKQRDGYCRVKEPVSGSTGWVYRALARRYPGETSESTTPSADVEEQPAHSELEDDLDTGMAGTTASEASDAVFAEYEPYNPSGKFFVYAGLPRPAGYPNPLRVLKNVGYVVGHDDIRRNPACACYRAFPFQHKPAPNRPKFSPDNRTASRVKHEDYTNSGYSRGHMAPNYAIWQCSGDTARRGTFLTSNITPQFQALNAGVWEDLEEIIADGYAYDYREVWVIVGPLYDNQPQQMGSTGIEIPDAFFLIILDEDDEGEPRALAFRFTHDNSSGGAPEAGLTTIDQVEIESGLDFFADLDDAIEAPLESNREMHLWKYELRNQ